MDVAKEWARMEAGVEMRTRREDPSMVQTMWMAQTTRTMMMNCATVLPFWLCCARPGPALPDLRRLRVPPL